MRQSAVLLALMSCSGCSVDDSFQSGSFAVPQIEFAPEQYVAYRTDMPLDLDGRLVEQAWLSAEWTADFVDIEGEARPAPRYRTRAKMIWDNEYFYVGAELEEPHVRGSLVERDTVLYRDNDFEVFVDPDGDTQIYYAQRAWLNSNDAYTDDLAALELVSLAWPVTIHATPGLFEASLEYGDQIVRVKQDGRVWR